MRMLQPRPTRAHTTCKRMPMPSTHPHGHTVAMPVRPSFLRGSAPTRYKRKMQKNKQQLQKKEDIYAIIKMAEQGEDVLDNPGGLPGFGDRSDTDGEESEVNI